MVIKLDLDNFCGTIILKFSKKEGNMAWGFTAGAFWLLIIAIVCGVAPLVLFAFNVVVPEKKEVKE